MSVRLSEFAHPLRRANRPPSDYAIHSDRRSEHLVPEPKRVSSAGEPTDCRVDRDSGRNRCPRQRCSQQHETSGPSPEPECFLVFMGPWSNSATVALRMSGTKPIAISMGPLNQPLANGEPSNAMVSPCIRNGSGADMLPRQSIRISNRRVVGWLLDSPPSTTSALPLT